MLNAFHTSARKIVNLGARYDNHYSKNSGDQAAPDAPDTPDIGEAVCDSCKGTDTLNGKQCPMCSGSGTGKVIEGIGGG